MINSSPFSLNGHNILITGASSGIGAAVAVLAAKNGAVCIINGRDEIRLNGILENLEGEGHIAINMDLSERNGKELVKQAVAVKASINGFVHCAGIEKTLPFRITEMSDLREIMKINLEAYWDIIQEILRRGNHKENLSIVSLGSVAAQYGAAGKTAYSASKGALISLTKSLAAEYANKKIRFNCVCPGYVDTPMLSNIRQLYASESDFSDAIIKKHPLGLGMPEDVAGAVVYLLSDASRWITGSVLTVDGGYGVR